MTMNRNIFILLIFSVFSIVLQAQEITVPQTQRPLITKRTASWCPNCGGWGWTFFRNVMDDNNGKAVFFANHYDGIHTSPTTLALATNFGGVSQPLFFLNNTNQSVSSGSTATQLLCTVQSPQPSHTRSLMTRRRAGSTSSPFLRRRRFSAAQVCS